MEKQFFKNHVFCHALESVADHLVQELLEIQNDGIFYKSYPYFLTDHQCIFIKLLKISVNAYLNAQLMLV